MKQTIYVRGYVKKEIEINAECPKCGTIVTYSFNKFIPEICPECSYPLSRPINPIRRFFHNLFWSVGGKSDVIKYQLAKYNPQAELKCRMEEIEKKLDILLSKKSLHKKPRSL